jgi:hypothetical protein
MFKTISVITSLISLAIVPIRSDNSTTQHAVVMTGMTTAERQATDGSLSLFAQAGLPLPPLEIRRHHDLESCNGSEGLHRKFGERSIIDICTVETGDYEQRTMLHELGHAWSEHFLTVGHKQAFQNLRRWTAWLDYKRAKWADNGAEQAAEIITWALSPHPVGVVKIQQNSCKDLHDGYVALTGREPLNGYTKLCKSSVSSSNRS